MPRDHKGSGSLSRGVVSEPQKSKRGAPLDMVANAGSVEEMVREYRKPGNVKPGDRVHIGGTWYEVLQVIVGEKTVALACRVWRPRSDGTNYPGERVYEIGVDAEVLTEAGQP